MQRTILLAAAGLLMLVQAVPSAAQSVTGRQNPRPVEITPTDLPDALSRPGLLDFHSAGTTPAARTALRTAPLAEGDERWDARFGMPGVWSTVSAVAFGPDGNLYAGGSFTEAGGLPMSYVARWDGRRWHSMGAGVDGNVYAIAVGDDGSVYVGGSFTKAGTLVVNGLARWDNQASAWSAVGGGLRTSWGIGTVRALAVKGTELYVGGDFTKAGDSDVTNLAVWNGAAWSSVGGGVGRINYDNSFSADGQVYAITVSGTDVYVGGRFQATPAGPANSIARWDGQSWSALGAGVVDAYDSYGSVYAIDVWNGAVYVGGEFAEAGGTPASNLAQWDGISWSPVGGGVSSTYGARVNAIEATNAGIVVGGSFTIAGDATASNVAHWDGMNWSALEGGTEYPVTDLETGPEGHVYVAGEFDKAGGHNVRQIARWDWVGWHGLGEGVQYESINGWVRAVATDETGKVYIGGDFNFVGAEPALNVAVWSGEDWAPLSTGADGAVYAIAVSGTDVYVGGDFDVAGGQAAQNIARWDAAAGAWSPLASGLNGPVYALALGADGRLYVGGNFTAAGLTDAQDVAIWDGAAWSKFGEGVSFEGGSVRALAIDGDDIFVGGEFSRMKIPVTAPEAEPVNALALWDAAADEWYSLDGGVTIRGEYSDYAGTVNALASGPAGLYVGGDFDKAGTVSANKVALLTPGGWTPLGSSVGGDLDVNTIVAFGNDVYVGGEFTAAGGRTVNFIARWNGAEWTSLGSGLGLSDFDNGVNALAVHGMDLYVAGDFAAAGGNPSSGFARWTLEEGGGPVAGGQITVDPLTLAFGEVVVGQPQTATLTITNSAAATGALTGTVNAPTGPFRILQGGGAFTLDPGASRQITVEFAPVVAGDAIGTLAIAHSGAGTPTPVQVSLTGSGRVEQAAPLILRRFDPEGEQFVFAPEGNFAENGFVFGTNRFGDRAKTVTFRIPAGKASSAGQLSGVNVYFAYKSPQITTQTYTLRVMAADPETGRPLPDQELFSAAFPLAGVNADADLDTPEEATVHTFDQPVEVPAVFAVVVDFGTYTVSTDYALAAIATTGFTGSRVADVWEQWQDGTWHNLSDAWAGQEAQEGTGTNGWEPWIEAVLVASSKVGAERPDGPRATALLGNVPNPFRASTELRYHLSRPGHVRLEVYDLLGRSVAVLVDKTEEAGHHNVAWNASDIPAGAYLYRLDTSGETLTGRMTIVR